MIKKILTASLCVLGVTTAYSFGPRALQSSERYSVYPGKVNVEKRITPTTLTRAEAPDSLNFTYADAPYSALSLNPEVVAKGDTLFLAFELTPEVCNQFAGDDVTRLNVTTGVYQDNFGNASNLVRDIKIFTAEKVVDGESLSILPTYIQDAELGDQPYTEYSIPLDNPIKIEGGKSLVLGYAFAIPNTSMYYVPVDAMPTEDTSGCLLGLRAQGSAKPIEWTTFSTMYGSICMGCTIKGDKFPENQAVYAGLYGVVYAEPGEEFNYHFYIQGKGIQTESVDVTVTVGDGTPVSNVITLDEPIGYNEYAEIVVPAVCNTEAFGVPVKYDLVKVNGVDNVATPNTVTTKIDCFPREKGYPRVNLIEEGTGTWCGWCPRGIVMMEYVNENYPDLFAGVALHSDDRMSVATVNTAIKKLFSGFPSAVVNRTTNLGDMSVDEIEEFVAIYGPTPALLGFDNLEANVDMEGNIIVNAKVGTGFDINNGKDYYRLAFYLVENGMGPYSQTNYYAGGANGEMGGWESMGRSVDTIYNDVARYLAGGFYGFANSLPTELVPGESYEYSTTFPVTSVKADEFELVAFIINNSTGEIANAKKISVENLYYLGVDEIASGAETVAKKYYNINGVEVKDPANGIYIVRSILSDGTVKTSKTIIK